MVQVYIDTQVKSCVGQPLWSSVGGVGSLGHAVRAAHDFYILLSCVFVYAGIGRKVNCSIGRMQVCWETKLLTAWRRNSIVASAVYRHAKNKITNCTEKKVVKVNGRG